METYSKRTIDQMKDLLGEMAVSAYKCTDEFPYKVRECLLPLVKSKFITTYVYVAYGKMTEQAWEEAEKAWEEFGCDMADEAMRQAINAYRGSTEAK